MKIRAYNGPSDDQAILELLRLNTPEYFSPEEEKDLVDYLARHAHHYFVAESDALMLGCGGFNLTEDGKTAKISWDIIHPESHGKGIGTELTRFRIMKIKEMDGIEMVSVRTSQLVYRFYEKFGFETREIVKDFWAPGFDLYRMECPLDSIQE